MATVDRRFTTPERFWSLVDAVGPDRCWLWLGRCDEKGYGRIGWRRHQNVRAHRIAQELTHGAIPVGLAVLHRCDNPPCCNPAHLFLGTQLENIADRNEKGRTRAAQPGAAHFAAKLTDDQVRAVRAEYERGLATQQALADRYGISRGALSKILTRRTYANVR